jgi:glycosyltransferase involved in cell wall biosynthesis
MSGVEIVVPVYNEAGSIDAFVTRLDALGLLGDVIFVDNASTDGTLECLEGHAVRIIRHQNNLGYGGSIIDGLASTTAATVVIIDADLEYPPEAIPVLLAALETHAVVYASRFRGEDPPDMPMLRRVGNTCISQIFNLLFRQQTTDLYTGMKAMRRDAISALTLSRRGFDHVAEMGVQFARAGILIHEVPVRYAPRTRGASKMRHLAETLSFARLISTAWLRLRLGIGA